jgi:hypothetical protein
MASEATNELIRAWRDATRETTTFLLWRDAVITAAVAKGADGDAARAVGAEVGRGCARLQVRYRVGEPVWMAADEVAFIAKYRARRSVEHVNGLAIARLRARVEAEARAKGE